MNPALALDATELVLVRQILARHLDSGVAAWAFGSRAGGKPKAWSDLDLVLEGQGLIPIPVLAGLAEDFSESPLPWKVDLVDRAAVSEPFGAIIDRTKVRIEF